MRRHCSLFLLIALIVFPLSAQTTGYYYSATTAASHYLGIAHFDDEIPARSSFTALGSFGLIGYQSKRWDGSVELQFQSVSRSLPYGIYRSRGFTSIGLALRTRFPLTDLFSLSAQIGTEVNFYHQIEEAFTSFSVQVGGQLLILENPTYQLFLTVPITVHLRKEITGVQTGIGLRYHLFPYHKGGPQ